MRDRIRGQWKDEYGDDLAIQIIFPDDSEQFIDLPLIDMRFLRNAETFDPVHASECRIQFLTRDASELAELVDAVTGQEEDIDVLVTRNTMPVWSGFILFDNSAEESNAFPIPFTVSAGDGLFKLKSEDHNLDEADTYINHIADLLSLTGTSFPIRIIDELREDEMTAASPAEQAVVDPEVYRDRQGRRLDAMTVLADLLESKSSRILLGESTGQRFWIIERVPDRTGTSYPVYTYPSTGGSAGNPNNLFWNHVIDRPASYEETGLTTDYPRQYKRVTSPYNHGTLLDTGWANLSFEDWEDANTPVNWDKTIPPSSGLDVTQSDQFDAFQGQYSAYLPAIDGFDSAGSPDMFIAQTAPLISMFAEAEQSFRIKIRFRVSQPDSKVYFAFRVGTNQLQYDENEEDPAERGSWGGSVWQEVDAGNVEWLEIEVITPAILASGTRELRLGAALSPDDAAMGVQYDAIEIELLSLTGVSATSDRTHYRVTRGGQYSSVLDLPGVRIGDGPTGAHIGRILVDGEPTREWDGERLHHIRARSALRVLGGRLKQGVLKIPFDPKATIELEGARWFIEDINYSLVTNRANVRLREVMYDTGLSETVNAPFSDESEVGIIRREVAATSGGGGGGGGGAAGVSSLNNLTGALTSEINAGTGLTGGGPTTDNPTLALAGQALAFHNLASNGLVARTGSGTVAARTITGTTNQITATNGNGVSGNPTLSLPQDIHTGANVNFNSYQVGGTPIVDSSRNATFNSITGDGGGAFAYRIIHSGSTVWQWRMEERYGDTLDQLELNIRDDAGNNVGELFRVRRDPKQLIVFSGFSLGMDLVPQERIHSNLFVRADSGYKVGANTVINSALSGFLERLAMGGAGTSLGRIRMHVDGQDDGIAFFDGTGSSGRIYRDDNILYVGARAAATSRGLAIASSGLTTIDSNVTVAADVKGTLQINTQNFVDTSRNVSAGNITFIGERFLTSPTFASGFAGGTGLRAGFFNSVWGAEMDELTVRGTMRVYELLIQQIRGIGGSLIVSAGDGKVESVNGNDLTIEDPEDNGRTTFAEDDMIMSQRVDLDSTTIVKRVIRRVTAVSGNVITVDTLAGAPSDTGTIEPGDEFVVFGNTSNIIRQNVIYITATDSGSPFTRYMSGIDSWATWTDGSAIRTQIGNLEGLTIPGLGNLHGVGALIERGYVTRDVVVGGRSLSMDSFERRPVALWHFDDTLVDVASGLKPAGIVDLTQDGLYTGDNVEASRRPIGRFGSALAVESAATNALTGAGFNSDFSNWATHAATVSLTQAVHVPEWQTRRATRIQTEGGDHEIKWRTGTLEGPSIDGLEYACSVYVKNVGEHPVRVNQNIGGGSGSVTVEPGESQFVEFWQVGNGSSNWQLQFRALDESHSLDFIAFQPMSVRDRRYAGSFTESARPEGICEIDPSPIWGLEDITISFWTRKTVASVEDPEGPQNQYALTLRDAAGTSGNVLTATLQNRTNELRFWTIRDGSGHNVTYSSEPWDGQSHHVAMVMSHNPASGRFNKELYFDGELVGSANTANIPDLSEIEFIRLGSWATSLQWNGELDDVAILPYALSPDEIRTVAHADAPIAESPQQSYIDGSHVRTGALLSQNWTGFAGDAGTYLGLNDGRFVSRHDGQDKIVFDSVSGTYKFVGEVTVTSGSEGISNFEDAGNLATLNQVATAHISDGAVEAAKLGSTIIEGGFIRTQLIDVEDLFAQNVTVGGILEMGPGGIITNEEDTFALTTDGLRFDTASTWSPEFGVRWEGGSGLVANAWYDHGLNTFRVDAVNHIRLEADNRIILQAPVQIGVSERQTGTLYRAPAEPPINDGVSLAFDGIFRATQIESGGGTGGANIHPVARWRGVSSGAHPTGLLDGDMWQLTDAGALSGIYIRSNNSNHQLS